MQNNNNDNRYLWILMTEVIAMCEDKEGREVDIMSTIKTIQATPELSGKDAVNLLRQANSNPTQKAMKKNNMLRSVLTEIRKS